MSLRALVIGGSGLLGRALARHTPSDAVCLAPTKAELPLEDADAIARLVRDEAISRVLLLAAWTRVDDCEADPERAFRVNGVWPARAARAAAAAGASVLFLSTDYVFDGQADHAYREYDPTRPLNVYGASKLFGEEAIRAASIGATIVRTSGLYGAGGPDFVSAIRARLAAEGPINVVDDQMLAPTSVEDLAPALWTVARAPEPGTLHLTATGSASWWEVAQEIALREGHAPARIAPISSESLARPARRPKHSVLSVQTARDLYGVTLPPWRDGIARHLGAR